MKIEVEELSVRNFGPFGNVEQKFLLTSGLHLISGRNGLGKSALCDAFTFAFFGKVLRDVNQDDLINWKNKKECVVTAKFIIGDNHYKIRRGLKPYFLEIYENDVLKEFTAKRDYQQMLEEDILKTNYQISSSLFSFNSNFSIPILKMKKHEKRAFVEQIFNITEYTRLNEITRKRLGSLEKRISIINQTLENNGILLLEYRQNIQKLRQDLIARQTAQKRIEELNKARNKLKEEWPKDAIIQIDKDIEIQTTEKINLEKKVAERNYKITGILEKIDEEDQKIILFSSNKCPTCGSRVKSEKLRQEAEDKIKKFEEAIERKRATNTKDIERSNKLDALIENRKKDRKDFYEATRKIENYKGEILAIQRFLEESDTLEDTITAYLKKIDDLEKKNEAFEEEILRINSLRDYLTYIRGTCKDEKVKQYAISHKTPRVNRYTNEYLAEVGFNFFVEIDKFIDARVRGPGIYGAPYGALSGGESKSVDLALSMSFHDIAQELAKNYFDVLFLDEILDSSVDKNNISHIFDIIKKKQKKHNLKTYVISHREEITEQDFDKIHKLNKQKGFTIISS